MSSSPRRQVSEAPAEAVGPSAYTALQEELVHQTFVTLLDYRKLVARVVETFGDEAKASAWLSLPNPDLGGQTPLRAAQECGYKFEVLEPVLTRIEHGIEL